MPHLDFSTYLGQIFWLAVIFSAIFLLFYTRFVPSISGLLERRENSIRKDLEAAQKLNNEIELLKNQIAQQKQQLQEQIANVINNARTQANQRAESDLHKLEQQLARTRHEAEEKLLQLKLNAQPVINDIATQVASELCHKLDGINLDKTTLKRLITSKTSHK